MPDTIALRPVERIDQAAWRSLWDGYNAFYGREGPTALPEAITASTWERFFSSADPVHAWVAVDGEQLVGLVHYLYHRSTTRLNDVCYLQDLFTAPGQRGRGVGRLLIQSVYAAAVAQGCSRVYWHTRSSNATARSLYDQVAAHLGVILYAREL